MDTPSVLADQLRAIPGGAEVVDWWERRRAVEELPEFNLGDAEIISLTLVRGGESLLKLDLGWIEHTLTFVLRDWIDVHIDGFSSQNVIGGMTLRRAGDRAVAPWELGVGLTPGDTEIELEPCFGANGRVRATIDRIEFVPTPRGEPAS